MNDIERAKQHLGSIMSAWVQQSPMDESTASAFREALSALEKQIPKKPRPDRDRFSYYCPSCDKEISDGGWYPGDGFCSYCGQAIEPEAIAVDNLLPFEPR